ncbi:MAG: tyrosine-type recombinase/integrase, partial [Deltaproteobacteria bacterium]|nr:tyrosine-type recombinase/integrase [Deltaproteobacteria bacterium]
MDNKMYYGSTRKTSRREAEKVLYELREKIESGKMPETKRKNNCKFVELAEKYKSLAELQKGYRSKKTFIRQLVEEFGNLNLIEINTLLVEQWRNRLLKRCQPATANRKLACLKHMFTKAVDWDMTTEEALKRVRKVKFQKESRGKLRFLDVDECQRLVECCQKHLRPIVTLAINTGMRRGEILPLTWQQIDLRHGYISLYYTKSGDGRQIPMNQSVIEMFTEMPRGLESKYVFANRNGDPLTNIKHSFASALKKAEISNATFHTLRHTAASHLVMAGVDLPSVKELLGHKSLTMTLRYAHLAPGHTKKAVNIL